MEMVKKWFGAIMVAMLLLSASISAAGVDALQEVQEVTFYDELADDSKMVWRTANWTVDSSGAGAFGGDDTRLMPTAASQESIVYFMEGLKHFSVRVHYFADSTASLTFYGSADGEAWTVIPAVHDTPVSSEDAAWKGVNYSPASAIPDGMDYFKIEIGGDEVTWRMQLGSVTLKNWLASAEQGDYYVDAEGGSDSNDGRSPESAWKSLAKVNEHVFAPGDRILLKTGGIWHGRLQPKGNGESGNPITISSYGGGNRPIINGGGLPGGTVYLLNQSHWVIENLEVTNSATERGNVFREGILVENAGAGTISGIRIANNYVHDVSGSFRYAGADPHAFGGISVYAGGIAGTDTFDHVVIEGNTVERVGRTGIVVWDQVWHGEDFSTTNVVIRQNYVKESDSDGIMTFGVDGGLIEYNVVEGAGVYSEAGEFNGTAAIWPTRGKNNIVQFNEAFNTYKPEGDGQGFNLDIDTRDSIVQYNYSHDNKGGFMLFVDASLAPGTELGSANNIVRYNISQNDLLHTFTFAGGVSEGTQIYNNTIFIGSNANTKIIDHEWDDAGNLNGSYSFRNNLIYNLGSGSYKLPGINGVFDHNLFYGNHPASEPADNNKITANPLLVYQGSGSKGWSSTEGYKLRAGSPALDAGVVIADNGGRDYWGNSVPSTAAPNIGAYSGEGLDPAGLPEPPEDDFTLIYHGLTIVPVIAEGTAAQKSLRLRFANDSDTAHLSVSNIVWGVGTLQGELAAAPAIAPTKSWDYEIALPGLKEGVAYPFHLTADIDGYKPISVEKQIDFNRVLRQDDKSSLVTIDLANGNQVVDKDHAFSGEEDLGGKLKLRWDDKQLYLIGEIRDDIFSHEASGIEIFRNDGIQFSIAPGMPGDSGSWYEYGIAMTPNGPEIYRWMAMQGKATGNVKNGELSIERDENRKLTTYQLRLPWSELYPIQPAAGQSLSFSLLVNDNDGSGRKGFIEWGSGIGGVKDSNLFRNIVLMNDRKEGEPVNSGNNSANVGANQSVIIGNGSITVNDHSGNSVADIVLQPEDVRTALEKANDGVLNIYIKQAGEIANGAVAGLPVDVIELLNSKAKSVALHIEGATVTIPKQTVADSGAEEDKPLKIVFKQIDSDTVYEYALQIDGENAHHSARSEAAVLSVAYKLQVGQQAHKIAAFVIGKDGNSTAIANSQYDEAAGMLTFKTSKLGRFVIKHVPIEFADITEAKWAATMIESLAARGIIIGWEEGKYGPNRVITRAQFLQSLLQLLQFEVISSEEQALTFEDVSPDSEYRAAIETAGKQGIVRGKGNGMFGPNDPITREEMALMLFRALSKWENAQLKGVSDTVFKDHALISPYALEAVERMRLTGVVNGYIDGTFKPKGLTTRAEAASVLYKVKRLIT